eukprot:s819_g37.t1
MLDQQDYRCRVTPFLTTNFQIFPGFTHKDSSPLIMGPSGSIFVYSGGVLMKISDDLSSAKKVMSVREELWLTEGDEGTPQFPEVCSVIGVHDGYLYRVLIRTDYREEVILRRLKCEDSLRRPRSLLRENAPVIWPGITDGRILVDPRRDAGDTGVYPLVN